MALFHFPNNLMSDLILFLDSNNSKCFSSGNTTCNNLITGGLVTGANGTPLSGTHTPDPSNFPVYNSGLFDFAGEKGMNCEEDLGNLNAFTLSVWFYKKSSNTEYITDGRNDGGQWYLSNYGSYNLNYTGSLTYNYGGAYNAANTNFLNQWKNIIVISDLISSSFYENGNWLANGSALNTNFGKNFRIGTRYTTSGKWTGYMSIIQLYSKVLNEDEIKQIYYAFRSRHGL